MVAQVENIKELTEHLEKWLAGLQHHRTQAMAQQATASLHYAPSESKKSTEPVVNVQLGNRIIGIEQRNYQIPQPSRWLTFDAVISDDVLHTYAGPNTLNEVFTVVAVDRDTYPGKTRLGYAYGLWPPVPTE